MIEWRAFLTSIGIDDANTVAGFLGGVVNVLRLKSPAAFTVVATTVSGALIANYLGAPIAKVISFPPIPTSFVVGFLGVQVLDIVLTFIKQKSGIGNNGSSTSTAPPSGGSRDANAR